METILENHAKRIKALEEVTWKWHREPVRPTPRELWKCTVCHRFREDQISTGGAEMCAHSWKHYREVLE